MPATKLTPLDSNDTGSGRGSSLSALSEFLNAIKDVEASQLDFEEKMQKLKITNVQNLGYLRKDQEQKLVEETTKANIRLAQKENTKKSKALQEEFDERMALTDKAFIKQYGMTKDQYKKEWALKKKNLDLENKARLKNAETEAKREAARKKREATKQKMEANKQAGRDMFAAGASMGDRLDAARKMFSREVRDENGNVVGSRKAGAAESLASVANLLSDMAKQLDNTINTVAGYKSAIDTRLQGSKMSKNWAGSYWEKMSGDITGIAGVSPLIKQSKVTENVDALVKQGIAFNVEQRAVLETMKDKIATTFNTTNATLLRLVRIQQQDTTAGRLGMESALTAFLNNMYETTEYMQGIAESVKGSLEEAMSLMSGENALSFEYQVQKWMGSLYSVGMSDKSVQGLAGVLGQVAAGQLEGITSGGQGNLVIMAANQAGLSISDLMANGLNADTTNELLNSMVDYLAKLYKEAGDNKVIQQQLANVYGVTASDLKAAVNLSKSTGAISRDGLTYSGAMNRLNSMANSMYNRTSIGEMMTNMWDNVQYSMAAGIGNNPALYAMYKAAGLLDTVAGGIAIPAFSVMGNMVDLETTVADLMRAGAMGGGILGSIGKMIAGGGGGGITGSGILRAAGIGNGLTTVSRGSGAGLSTAGGASVSQSGGITAGNASGEDVQSKTMTDANDSSKAQLAEAVDESTETKLKDVKSEVVNIFDLLERVTTGMSHFDVNIINESINTKSL